MHSSERETDEDPEERSKALHPRTRTSEVVAVAHAGPLHAELAHPFRFIVFDWDGTAVESRASDASRVSALLDGVLGLGARAAVVTGTKLEHVANQLGDRIAVPNRSRLFVATNRGSEVYGFDRRGAAFSLSRREATAEENRLLDAIAEEVVSRLVRLTSLSFGIVYDRMNRRKIDLIPEPPWADPPKSANRRAPRRHGSSASRRRASPWAARGLRAHRACRARARAFIGPA